jgi:subtilisin family serine protease
VYALDAGREPRWGAALPREIDVWSHGASASLGCCLTAHLDESRRVIGVPEALRADGGALTGRGVVLGVVDSGFDLAHPDLRSTDGTTRVAWFLDYTTAPTGAHPALEARYSFALEGRRVGAIYNRAELDTLLARGVAPDDPIGHGTHVASIAGGSGGLDARYVGVAPGASLVLVRASLARERASIPEATVVAGTDFIFDRAEAMRSPAVVTLSVGTHLGAHDGDSTLERALASFERPGRAIVVSAGNDGQRPLHARGYTLPGSVTELPFRAAPSPADGPGDVVGIAAAFTTGVSLAVRTSDGHETPWVAPGEANAWPHPDATDALVSLASATDGASPTTGVRGAVIVLASGGATRSPRRGGTYALLARGGGRVDAWFFQSGDARTADDAPRFLPPYGDTDVTVTLPATSPSVIAVGAVTTRTRWSARDGSLVTNPDAREGTVAPWSSRGPDFLGRLKPDLVAPGDVVIAALSSRALFSDARLVQPDRAHLAASGTSAAAPHVAGSIALLMEEFPSLTRREALSALAAEIPAADLFAAGWGSLRVDRALAVLRHASPERAAPTRSSCVLARTTLAVDESIEIPCRVADTAGMPTYATVTLMASAGVAERARTEGRGRYVLRYTARDLRGGDHVRLTPAIDENPLTPWALTIARDPRVGNAYELAGGCRVNPPSRAPWWLGVIALARCSTRRSRWGSRGHPGRSSRRRARG